MFIQLAWEIIKFKNLNEKFHTCWDLRGFYFYVQTNIPESQNQACSTDMRGYFLLTFTSNNKKKYMQVHVTWTELYPTLDRKQLRLL